ncbi:hypothetical protein, partial [Aeromonas veronii]|uniref:hypothetical protein n=1 Tax=Aeromonas veronii TaxID=654 RepID=UPI003D19C76E
NTITGYRQQKPKIGLTKCPDLVDHYTGTLTTWQGKARYWWFKALKIQKPGREAGLLYSFWYANLWVSGQNRT